MYTIKLQIREIHRNRNRVLYFLKLTLLYALKERKMFTNTSTDYLKC